MKGYNLDLYEVNQTEVFKKIVNEFSLQGGEHVGDRGGVCLRLHEKPEAT